MSYLSPNSYTDIKNPGENELLKKTALTQRAQSYIPRSPIVSSEAPPTNYIHRSQTSFTPGRYACPPQSGGTSLRGKSQYDVTVSSKIYDDFIPQNRHEEPAKQPAELQKAEKEESHEKSGEPAEELPFPKSKGLTSSEAESLLQQYGKNALEDKSTPKWLIFVRLLYQPMPLMIWLAIIVEAAIENWTDMGILLGIQFANAFLGFYETTKAGNAVAALKASLKPEATVYRDGKWQTTDATLLVPSDLVLLGSGSAVPADCSVNEGQIDVDQSALTGESLPVTVYPNEMAKMGSTVVRGEVQGTVQYTGKNTFFGKTASLLQVEEGMGNLQKILIRIMIVLVIISLTLCIISLAYLLSQKEAFKEALSFTVVLLVASVPVAIEIVVTTTLAVGSRQLAEHGAIVVRLAAIEDMAGMNILCSDKTGTLTLNKMVIQEQTPVYMEGYNQRSILQHAAMAAKWHEPPRDALDTLVLGSADIGALKDVTQLDYMPFDPTQKRTEGSIRMPNGETFKVTKGAPHIISRLLKDHTVVEKVEADVKKLGERGIRCLAVAKTDKNNNWTMLGLLTFLDPPRPDTKETIAKSEEYGVEVKMITGDHLLIARETARVLGMGTNIQDPTHLPSLGEGGAIPTDLKEKYGAYIRPTNGFAQVYPEHKFLIVETLRQLGFKVGMTGDGVNDAPALKRADVGVAVQGATDAARAAADIVLTQPGLSTIVVGIIVARMIFARMKNFIIYRIAATLQLICFFFIAVFALQPVKFMPNPRPPTWHEGTWPNFFRMPVILLMLITLLNDGTLISVGYDRVTPSQRPEKWNLRSIFLIAAVLAGVACISSLMLLWALLGSWQSGGLFADFGGVPLNYGQVTTCIYLKVSISDFLTLFSARTRSFFFTTKPSLILLGAGFLATAISTAIAVSWPDSEPDDVKVEGLARSVPKLLALWIWIYCIACWFIQDAVKVVVYKVMEHFNLFNIKNLAGGLPTPHSALDDSVRSGGPQSPV